MSSVTELINAIGEGDQKAANELLPLLYDELRQLASHKLAQEKPGQTLQATALVHEAYLRLAGSNNGNQWNNRGHFFAAAAEAMRRILIENARRKHFRQIDSVENAQVLDIESPVQADPERWLLLDDALLRFEQEDPEAATLCKMRLFAGLSIEQAGEALGISRASAFRRWTYARAWLRAQWFEVENNE